LPAGEAHCRIVRVDLTSGAHAESETRDLERSRCSHGGGVAIDGSRIWLADTKRLLLLNANLLFTNVDPVVEHCGQKLAKKPRIECRETIDLVGISGSFLAKRGSSFLVGDYKKAMMYEFSSATLLQQTTIRIGDRAVSSTDPKKAVVGPVASPTAVAANPQGADFGPGGLVVSSSTSECGRLTLNSATTYGFGPGVEEIEFATDGSLWAVFEAGSKAYPNAPFFPVIAQFDPALLKTEAVEPQTAYCVGRLAK
jgi:hypothetical protein